MRKLGAIVLLLAACSPRGGEGWAKKYLGEEGRETIRTEAKTIVIDERHIKGRVGPRPYLPKPYVVVQIPDGETRPFFHDMNLEIDPPPSSVADVRGIVVLRPELKLDNKPGIAGKQRSHNEYSIHLIDRSARTVTIEHANRVEELPSILAGLPPAP